LRSSNLESSIASEIVEFAQASKTMFDVRNDNLHNVWVSLEQGKVVRLRSVLVDGAEATVDDSGTGPSRGLRRGWERDASGAGRSVAVEVIEFRIGHGDMVRLLRASGFEIEDLIEIQAPNEGADAQAQPYVPLEWARRWPSAEAWKVRKLG
jgi:hypothetical protein